MENKTKIVPKILVGGIVVALAAVGSFLYYKKHEEE